MSRHIIPANDPRFEIVVGYDRPLGYMTGGDAGARHVAPHLLRSRSYVHQRPATNATISAAVAQ
jgi:hypothetical protein